MNPSPLKIVHVRTKAQFNAFIDLPYALYRDDPYFVAPLRMAVKDVLSVEKNPFFKHAYRALFLAEKDGKVIGRVAGVIDDHHNKFHDETAAFFGFFECIHDQTVANALFDAVIAWAKERNCTRMVGPMNPSTNHECGLLVEGFNDTPYVLMTYNPPYYLDLITHYGFTKEKDLLAYETSQEAKISERMLGHIEKVKEKGQITIRPVNMRKFDEEVQMILDIYNDAWENNWGFIPMTAEEFRHMANDMKLILDPDLLLIAELRGEPVGFGLALPDINQVLHGNKSGRLFPAIFKLLFELKVKKIKMNRCRVLTLGIRKRVRELGIGPILYAQYYQNGPANGYPKAECSWILEDNIAMNKAMFSMGGAPTKRYRIFSRSLA